MTKALIALHFQNDICHPDGLIPFAIDRSAATPDLFLDRSRTLITRAREANWLVVHVHIVFQPDYSDLPRNAKLFKSAGELGALKLGTWGAAPTQGFEPASGDVALIHTCNNAFHGTGLESILRERAITDIAVAGLATQYSVEHTVRHAADLGYSVIMVRDCCGTANAAAAEASFAAMAMLADIKNLDEITF
jgi:nicotinamidase-related amidase